ncbi:hypothetical protein GRS66_010142 [Saccharomyces pastorianus]|uniref:Uncharacterized protein n=1 Tax=Saccharomyces pastorianus TaxID=27292 RepID=A0A6C1EED8_SACPS|nr:hypothetical protein GRS66_010142 [Saccharomyces pastorianus]
MESQQLHQNPHYLHGSAYASVTSKEVPSNQDPLAVSASIYRNLIEIPLRLILNKRQHLGHQLFQRTIIMSLLNLLQYHLHRMDSTNSTA